MDVNNYGLWTLIGLRSELRKRGAKLSGRKHELVGRSRCVTWDYCFSSPRCDRVTIYFVEHAHYFVLITSLLVGSASADFQTMLAFRFLTSSAFPSA